MSEQSNNKTIAKNTILLYIRMMFTMIVSLYTSRVILDVLGIEDYGIYQTVGGIVLMLSFVNNALANGISRFLTYELGTGNIEKLKKTFSTVLWANIGLSLLVVLIAETLGLCFVYNKLVIPIERMDAAIVAYHFSIITCFFQLILVPYNSCIIAHEKMGIYAYMSIIDVCLKLAICYMLSIGGFDKLMTYAILLCGVQFFITLFYILYCSRNYFETKFKLLVDSTIFKDVVTYSSWSLLASSATAINTQGAIVLINMFFNPTVVSARAIANQVNMAANQFIQNFRTAANPQIVKKYASGDYEGSKKLLLESTKFSFYLMLILALPICLVADILLNVWLKEVPVYASMFLQLAIITSLFQVFDSSFYTALYAKGQIKENALTSPTLGLLMFPICYILFRFGCTPIAMAWAMMGLYAFLGLIQKPILLIRIVGYSWKDIYDVFRPCIIVTMLSCPIPTFLYLYKDTIFSNVWAEFFTLITIAVLNVLVVVWLYGISMKLRAKLSSFFLSKFNDWFSKMYKKEI